jgi:hypothetical protein
MSVENGERFIRLLETDPELRRKVSESGESAFLDHSASVGASCTPSEVVSAMIRGMDSVS